VDALDAVQVRLYANQADRLLLEMHSQLLPHR
jgi:hypothetical protein